MELDEILTRMHTGGLYFCNDETLIAEQCRIRELLYDYNLTRPSQQDARQSLLRQMFAEIGENCFIETPFHANWGGRHVHFGHDVYANFNLTLVDDTHIYVGDNVLFGPNVTVCTGTHPIHPELRRRQAEYNLPIHIGNNVWIGGGSYLMPGVTIGDNTVIGACSLVTKDIPANVVAYGQPCRVQREISRKDWEFYHGNHPIDLK